MERLRRWIEKRKPSTPPDNHKAEQEHEEARQRAFWASEKLLDEMRNLECVADDIRFDRQQRRGR